MRRTANNIVLTLAIRNEKKGIVMRLLPLLLAIALSGCQSLGPRRHTDDEFMQEIQVELSRGMPVEFIESHDPGYVVLRYEDGREIHNVYEGVDWSVLSNWEDEMEKTGKTRTMTLTYKASNGVEVVDNHTGTRFTLRGPMTLHPIDRAKEEMKKKHGCTAGMVLTADAATKTWEAEFNRLYAALGGEQNERLREAHQAWLAYREAQIAFLQENYGEKDGTIWPVTYAWHILEITKQQAVLLQAVDRDR